MKCKREFYCRLFPFLLFYSILSQYEVKNLQSQHMYDKEKNVAKRRKKMGIPWSDINQRLSNPQFHRIFRMTRDCYTLLCNNIIVRDGERVFKSESYIDASLRNKVPIYIANCHTTGG